jgi:trimeric autotransporter adhesin
MNPLIQLQKAIPTFVVSFVFAYFAFLSTAQAVSPPPDGGYPGQNTAEGQQALLSLTTGQWNTALGFQALKSDTIGTSNTATGGRALFSNTTGIQNTANGAFALFANTVGGGNSAFGFQALTSNTTGRGNTANGHQALASNTTGGSNTAVGNGALSDNTTGEGNTAIGGGALGNNTTGKDNTANGDDALAENTTGRGNTAVGSGALDNNTTGNDNTANGDDALFNNTTGNRNTAIGDSALVGNTTGNDNTATGIAALRDNTSGIDNTANGVGALSRNTGSSNTAVGKNALSGNNGSLNIALGWGAGTGIRTGSNNIDIGNGGASADVETIRIGQPGIQTATFIAGISGATVTGTAVVVNGSGQLGLAPSSARFKEAIKSMDNASEALFSLKPVTFRYKKEIDSKGIPQFGLVAEEVAEVNADLVVRHEKGEIYTVRYEAVNAMLLNEFLKAHRKIEEQGATLARQQKQIEALTVGLQRVSDKMDLSKPAPQTVLNNQ